MKILVRKQKRGALQGAPSRIHRQGSMEEAGGRFNYRRLWSAYIKRYHRGTRKKKGGEGEEKRERSVRKGVFNEGDVWGGSKTLR